MSGADSPLRVRLRDDVERCDGGRLLVGGSPLRAVRLSPAATRIVGAGTFLADGTAATALAGRLLDGNLADPEPGGPVDAALLTVVVPVRDRAASLDRALAALAGVAVIVVDDASRDPVAVAEVAARHGAELVALPVNRGPAGARNAGLARATTPYVAFVDSDVTVSADTLRGLAAHLADPRVALVGPRVRGSWAGETGAWQAKYCLSSASFPGRPGKPTARPRWFERYDVLASSLDLGPRPAAVRPGAAVGWLPSACLVGRRSALGDGFTAELRVGEDVDLVWRLVAAGHVVRYDPAYEAGHEVRGSVRGWLGRKVLYGSGGAELAARHGDAVAPAVLSPVMAAGAAALLVGRWRGLPVAGAVLAYAVRQVDLALPEGAGRGVAARLGVRGLGWALRQEAALLLRHWWPATAVAALVSRRARRAVLSALVVDAVVAWSQHGRAAAHPAMWVARRLDDVAYGAGLWLGAWRRRSGACLRPVSGSRRRRRSPRG